MSVEVPFVDELVIGPHCGRAAEGWHKYKVKRCLGNWPTTVASMCAAVLKAKIQLFDWNERIHRKAVAVELAHRATGQIVSVPLQRIFKDNWKHTNENHTVDWLTDLTTAAAHSVRPKTSGRIVSSCIERCVWRTFAIQLSLNYVHSFIIYSAFVCVFLMNWSIFVFVCSTNSLVIVVEFTTIQSQVPMPGHCFPFCRSPSRFASVFFVLYYSFEFCVPSRACSRIASTSYPLTDFVCLFLLCIRRSLAFLTARKNINNFDSRVCHGGGGGECAAHSRLIHVKLQIEFSVQIRLPTMTNAASIHTRN